MFKIEHVRKLFFYSNGNVGVEFTDSHNIVFQNGASYFTVISGVSHIFHALTGNTEASTEFAEDGSVTLSFLPRVTVLSYASVGMESITIAIVD